MAESQEDRYRKGGVGGEVTVSGRTTAGASEKEDW
jgi:hypothetical protein